MRAVLQRVRSASVYVGGDVISRIGHGMLILLGVEKGDTPQLATGLARKVAALRIFSDEDGRMNLSCEQIQGEFMVVSQFTLCADLSKGHRPGFDSAMPSDQARAIYELFCEKLREFSKLRVATGSFGAYMQIEILNDGPVTFILEAHPS
jgi:D-tyrosyl-tRNA(Tyr) deacylase